MASQISQQKKSSDLWKFTTLIFALFFLVMALYHFDLNFNQSFNSIFNLDGLLINSNLPNGLIQRENQIYIPYDGPTVNLTVIKDPKCKDEKSCDIEKYISVLKRDLTLGLKVDIKNYTDPEAKTLLDSMGIKALPAFIFDENVTEVPNYKYMQKYFKEKNGKYLLLVQASQYLFPPDLNEVYNLGVKDAKVNVVWYGNYSCKDCKGSTAVLERLLKDYKEKINIYYKHLITSDKDFVAAEAVECAGEQGNFLEFLKVLFDKQSEIASLSANELKTKISSFASELKLNMEIFNSCIETGKYRSKVVSHKDEAENYGLDNPPVLLINNEKFEINTPYENLQKYIDKLLQS